MWIRISYLIAVLSILMINVANCDFGDDPVTYFTPDQANFDAAFKHLEFECIHEADRLPHWIPTPNCCIAMGCISNN